MGKTCKTLALLLTLIIALSCLTLLTVEPAGAQSTAEPAVTEFNILYVANSSDKPAQAIAEAVTAPPTPSTQPTPYQLVTPSAQAPPHSYSVPPLSNLRLTVNLNHGEPCYGALYIYGGSGNDINLKIINPDGNTVQDFGRVSNQSSFKFYADKTGNYTFILDNEFSVFSSKEVSLYKNPFSTFEFAGYSINFWVIIAIVISLAVLVTIFTVLLRKHTKEQSYYY